MRRKVRNVRKAFATTRWVTLTGHASSWRSIEDAAHAAWAAPGVTEVVDQLKSSAF